MDFKLSKQNALTKDDKSHETKWDDKIKPLCDKINESENFFTTSSCSGRITIIKATTKKVKDAFLFKSHDKVTLSQVKASIPKNPTEQLYFRQEPCALHVAADNLEDAQDLLNKARNIGFKKSGIISSKDNRYIIEMFSTELIASPLPKNPTDELLELLIKEANIKLEKTWSKIEKLSEVI